MNHHHQTHINQNWYFSKKNIFVDAINLSDFEPIHLPHTFNGKDGQDGENDYLRSRCTYVHHLEIVKEEGRKILLFEAVNSIAEVWINKQFVGRHEGGYSAFSFDITDFVHEGINDLVVYADNRFHPDIFPLYADFTFYGGIYRNVYLINVNNIAFDRIQYGAMGIFIEQKDISERRAILKANMHLINHSKDHDFTLKIMVSDQEHVLYEKRLEIEIDEKGVFTHEISLGFPRLWQGIDDPFLYEFIFQIIHHNVILDQEHIHMGLRSVKIDEQGFYLNGKKVKLHGVSRHQDYPDIGNALLLKHHQEDLRLVTELGANAIRLAHYQQAEEMYQLCSDQGLLVWAEIPYITVPSKTDLTGQNARIQLEELIMQNYNQTSIVMWGIQNEITAAGKVYNLEAIIKSLHQRAKVLDPYRLTTQAHLANLDPIDTLNTQTDASGFNLYYGWYFGETEDLADWFLTYRKKQPKRCVAISEYGVDGNILLHSAKPKAKDYSEEYQALWHEKTYKIIERQSFVWGSFVWNMFDFGSDGRDEGATKGKNNKGLITFDRQIKKDAFYFYQASWSKHPVLHLCSKRFVNRTEDVIEVKAYSNQSHVTFYHNDQLLETVSSDDVIFTLKIHLKPGLNEIEVRANHLEDTMKIMKVQKKYSSYECPKRDESKVKNWFLEVVKDYS